MDDDGYLIAWVTAVFLLLLAGAQLARGGPVEDRWHQQYEVTS